MAKNLGEQNEIFLKVFLLMMFKKNIPIRGSNGIGLIKSLKFSPDGELPLWKNEYEKLLEKRDYNFLKKIFPKAPTGSKADLEINGIRYSVKNSLGAKSAIVNHTNRGGFLKIFNLLNLDISKLDEIINEYWDKRISGIIKEDTKNQDSNSPFAKHKVYLKPIIEYFLFTGTGRGKSNFPADKMFIFSEPEDTLEYKILTQSQAVDDIWDNLTFSVRSKKGMPRKYDPKKDTDLTPWIRFYPTKTSSPKGALHIRS